VAAVVDTRHPAARSDGFLATSDHFDVGLVVFGAPADVWADAGSRDAHPAPAVVPTTDVELIGGAVDAAIRRSRHRLTR
jgi:hypothetical protein